MIFALNSLRYEDVRQQVVDFLKDRGEYNAEFDYEGSNLAYVIDTMAYVTMLMSYMLSQDANNRFLDTTEIRKNAVSIAKTLGYRPLRKKVARFIGTFVYQGNGFDSTSQVTIAPKSIFKAGSNQYVNLDPVVCSYSSATELKGDFALLQGEFREIRVFGNGEALQSIVVPSLNVAEDYLKVYIKNTVDGDDTKVEWTYAKTFFDSTQENIFFVEEDRVNEGMPKIVFGNGIVGRIPSQTETIIIEWLETKGASANGDKTFVLPIEDVPGSIYTAVNAGIFSKNNFRTPYIPPSSSSYGGTDLETLESIKSNAPMYYAAAGRGVTANDYRTLGKEFTTIEHFNVIGGDELFPGDITKLGNTYFTGIPKLTDPFLNNDRLYLTEMEELEVLARAKDVGIIATQKFFTKPSYVFLDVTPYVELKQNISANDSIVIKSNVVDNLNSHFSTRYAAPGVPFRESKLNAAIDNTEGVISSYSTISYSMVLNYDSFYLTKENRLYFPVIAVREPSGRIVPGEFTNFVKMNSQIVEESNGQYTIFDLPPAQCSVYGPIEEIDGTPYQKVRYLYNNDAVETEIFQVRELSNNTLSIVPKQFRSQTGDYVMPMMTPGGSGWNISFDNDPNNFVATIDFTVNPPLIQELTIDGHVQVLDDFGVITVDGNYLAVTQVASGSSYYWSIHFVIASDITNIKVSSEIPAFTFTNSSTVTGQYIPADKVANNTDPINDQQAAIYINTGSAFMWDVDATNDSTLPDPVANASKICRVVVPGNFPNSLIADTTIDYRKGDWLYVNAGKWTKAKFQGTLDASVDPLPLHVEHGDVANDSGSYVVYDTSDPSSPWKPVVLNATQLSGLYDFPKQREDWTYQLCITEEEVGQTAQSVADITGLTLTVGDVIYFEPAPTSAWVKADANPTYTIDPNSVGLLPNPALVTGKVYTCTDRGAFTAYNAAWFKDGVRPTVDLDDKIISLDGVWVWLDPADMSYNLDARYAQNLPIPYTFGSLFDVSETGDFNGYFSEDIQDTDQLIFTGVWEVFAETFPSIPTIPNGQIYQIVKTGDLGTATTYYAGDHIVSYNASWVKVEPFSVVITNTGLVDINSDPVLDWSMAADKTFTYTVKIKDIFDGAVVGQLNYLTGECLFNQTITGHTSMNTTVTTQTNDLFSLFNTNTSDYKMALFRLIPVDKNNGDPETDFDTGYNQVVKARVNPTRNKSELQ